MYLYDLLTSSMVTILAFQAQVAWSHIDIQPEKPQNHIQTGLNVTFIWKREMHDPTQFDVGKHLHNDVTLSEILQVDTHNKTSGTFQTYFRQSGKFHLLAFQHKPNATEIRVHQLSHVYTSKGINVLSSANTTSSSSVTPVSAASTASASSRSPNNRKFPTSVIIAVCLGSALLAVVILSTVYVLLRKRRRRLSAAHAENPYAFSNSFAPSPTPSRAWLLHKVGQGRGVNTSTVKMTSKGDDRRTAWPDTINFYHTPRLPPAAAKKKSSSSARGATTVVSNGTDTSLSSMQFSAKTERQMEIDERIEELQGKLFLLQKNSRNSDGRPDSRTLANMTHNMRLGKFRNQIERLQELKGSDWALGRTDVAPKGLYGPESIV
ncbi:hypothetical protein D9757_002163 [Collybiopsis confluens]|uniref:Uncharacterized protein n=1 Tax=Collybiopsis confluens TaxID=2823264 RepID=A0A8H5HZX6_9AGAR|nr:hypothetical protein D9757_002163 [Collybiopsis confluens]